MATILVANGPFPPKLHPLPLFFRLTCYVIFISNIFLFLIDLFISWIILPVYWHYWCGLFQLLFITHVIFIFIPHVQSFIVALQKMYDFMWKQIVPPLMDEQFSVSIIPCKFVCYDSYRSAMKSGRLAN